MVSMLYTESPKCKNSLFNPSSYSPAMQVTCMSIDATKLLIDALEHAETSAIPNLLPYAQLNFPGILHAAVRSGDLETLRSLPKKKIPTDSLDTFGHTALHIAASACDPQAMQILLTDFRADASAVDSKGRTALHLVAQHLNACDPIVCMKSCPHCTPLSSCVALLLAAGADPLQPDRKGRTALFWAKARGNRSVADLLGEAPCEPPPEMLFAWGSAVASAHGLQPTAGMLGVKKGKK